MSSKEWADQAVNSLKRVADAAKGLQTTVSGVAGVAPTGQPAGALSPDAVAAALEVASRNTNSTMVQIAIRLNNLAAKNSQRAA